MWELDHKESWVLKNWCFWTVILEKILESPLDCKEIKPVNPQGNQPWIFSGRTDAEIDIPILWPPDGKSQFIRKKPWCWENWRQEEKDMTEDKIVGWHHWLNGLEFEQAQMVMVDGEGQGSLACCSPWFAKSRTWLSDLTTTLGMHDQTFHTTYYMPILPSFQQPDESQWAIHSPTNISESNLLWLDLWSLSVQWGQNRMFPQWGDSLKKEIHRKQGSMQTHRLLHILLVPRRKRGVLLEEVRGVPYTRGH